MKFDLKLTASVSQSVDAFALFDKQYQQARSRTRTETKQNVRLWL